MQSFIKRYSIFLMIFIAIQPVLDSVTGLMARMHMDVTFGVVIRMIVMAISAVFILIYLLMNRDNKKGFLIIGYFVILALVSVISLIINYKTKKVFIVSEEVQALAKSLYYPIMLVTYYFAFEELIRDRTINRYFPKVIFIAGNIISIIMIIAHFTHTGFSSYSYYNLGESGWFYAANELSAFVSIMFPIMLWYALKKVNSWSRWYYWISVVIALYSALLIGTKGSFIAILLGLGIAIIAAIVQRFQNGGSKKLQSGMILLLILTLVGVGVSYPQMAVSRTNELHNEMLKYRKKAGKKKLTSEQERYVKTNKFVSYIFSGRTIYFEDAANHFSKATPAQKTFGMGYATNYKNAKKAKLVEMDYVDIFFQFGILGSIIYMLPLIYSLIMLIILFFSRFKHMWSYKWSMLVASVCLGFGMAMLTGHVIEAPSVSIYFVSILAFALYNAKLYREKNEDPISIDVES
ncbi:O-antigen ligase family protein [Companilactobacillus metriopterae]|uniref:O-antigen ligase family protein n=1 Tax=Companilactobacillus metriopterae TaxID=1909267 RepID=UPI00100A61DC|nr:O-antigen ligase family protein [Companilactobacillus metriopterae]